MGTRYRKSIKMGPFRINISKSGIGYSFGGKGFRYTKTANGRDRITASIPGTGISYVTESKAKKSKSNTGNVQKKNQQSLPIEMSKQYKFASVFGKTFGYPAVLLGIITLFISPIFAILFIAIGAFLIYYANFCKKMYAKSKEDLENEK